MLQVTPKASANRLGEVFEDEQGNERLKVYATSAPEDGKANMAVMVLLSKTFKIPKTSIEVIKGHHDRRKVVLIRQDTTQLQDQLESLRQAQ